MIVKLKKVQKALTSLFNQTKNLSKKYGKVYNVDSFILELKLPTCAGAKTLDLGCGSKPRNPFLADIIYGVDIREDLASNVKQVDLSLEGLPFDNDSFDYCTAFDCIEHIPRIINILGVNRLSFLELMNEIHRILKPGGLFLHRTPAFPSKEAFQDPTHVNIITEDTFPFYFCDPHLWAHDYGFKGKFELVSQRWESATWIICLIKAIK